MPNAKTVRKHYKKIRFHLYRLQVALNNAHSAGVINYDQKNAFAEGPCSSLGQVRERVRITTEKALAQAMREEIMSELKNAW